ncbi:MAG TPA: hypothetical protein VMA77_25600 [Solirubrobacteraceae bacterium]|nr:hypothetical protein [Solirubrobacteraceae bacterium]
MRSGGRGVLMGARWCFAVAALAMLVLPPSAAGAAIDTASAHVALRAYGRFVRSVLSEVPAWRRAGNRFTASAHEDCANALAPTARAPLSPATFSFLEEFVGDATVLEKSPTRLAFKLFRLRLSDVCADARALAASKGNVTPPETRRWVARFVPDLVAQETGLSALVAVLGHTSSPADRGRVRAVRRLVRRIASACAQFEHALEGELFAVLGLPAKARGAVSDRSAKRRLT